MFSIKRQDLLTFCIYITAAVIGVAVFIYPFFLNSDPSEGLQTQQFQTDIAPIMTFLLLIMCLSVLFLEIQGQAVSAKVIASLGVLVAAAAALRFLEVAIPGPGGFSPMFVPVMLAGYVFGARFGFLMGTMTMLVSGLITGGIGPWLPYQMFASGWIGMTAGWLPHLENDRFNLLILIVFGAAWGIFYGLILNFYFWPIIAGGGNFQREFGTGIGEIIYQYLIFYVSTSLVWDIARAAGNVLLIGIIGLPAIKVLTRFRDKYRFEVA